MPPSSVVLAASSSFQRGSSRQLRQMLATNTAAWNSTIRLPSSQLLLPVLPAGAAARQGPFSAAAESLIQLPFSVQYQRSSSTDIPASAAVSFQAEVIGHQRIEEKMVLRPCNVQIDRQLKTPVAAGQIELPHQEQQQRLQLQQRQEEPAPASIRRQQQQQSQLQQAVGLQDHQQLLQDGSVVSYVAYFRALPRSMCGTSPQVSWPAAAAVRCKRHSS